MRIHSSLVLMFIIVLCPLAAFGYGQSLNVIYTGGLHGELESCGCSPKTDFGGVARLAGYITGHEKALAPYVLVDAGNFAARDTSQGRLKTGALLNVFSILRYDAVAFLGNETVFPQEFFSARIKKHKIPALARDLPYPGSISVIRNDTPVNISTYHDNSKEGSLNILLTDRSVSELKNTNKWDVIIISSGEVIDEPLLINDTIIVAGYPKGEKLGVLTLHLDPDRKIKDFKHAWLPLGSDIEEDKRVREVLNDYDAKVARLLKESARPADGTSFVGVSRCAECHQLFVESWEKTRHARAFSSLEQVGKAADPECIVCHSVGFGEEGGFSSIETTPYLANVQCEVCHGLNRKHLDDFSSPMKTVTEEVCLQCHTESNSPDFNYPVYLEKIKHL